MKILLKFSLFKKNMPNEQFLFWSCVLDTSIDAEIVKYEHLNKENEHKIEACDPLWLRMEYLPEEKLKNVVKKHQKRPAYFVGLDKTLQTGSPYNDSASLVETYYQDALEFVKKLREFSGFDSDYKFNLLHRKTIKLIRELLGIDITKNESTAGALSVYNKLPTFLVAGNFSSAKGSRYITVSALEDLTAYTNLSVQIEITDKEKILFSTYKSLTANFSYILPDYLEDFSKFLVSVFGRKKEELDVSKIYEERFHLFRSFRIGMSLTGSRSKIVSNRYLDKPAHKINVYDYQNTVSNNPKDFFDNELTYKSLIYGKDKEYLESRYFDNTMYGKKAFREYVIKILYSAKRVKIIDAFFDNYGLADFSACCNSHFQLTVVTTDPKKRKRAEDYITNTDNLLKRISRIFPDTKVYYVPKLHDRYLYVENDSEKKLYSLSNSWNGTVNHYSMFIQEVHLETALQIYEEINDYTNEKYLQPPETVPIKKIRKTPNREKYTGVYIEALQNKIKELAQSNDVKEIIDTAAKLFFAHYFGRMEKRLVHSEIRECLEKLPEPVILNIIDTTTEMLLLDQKKSFDGENVYLDGRSFDWYSTPRKCLDRFKNISMWYDMRSYRLNLNYGLSELLSICFSIKPICVINSLLQHEKTIYEKITYQTDYIPNNSFRVSEFIIQSFLTEYYPFRLQSFEQLWDFIEKAGSFLYIRMFFAVSIINEALLPDNESSFSFEKIIDLFAKLQLSQNEIALVLGRALNAILLLKQSPVKLQNDYQNSIIEYIAKNSDKNEIIDFSLIAFIEPYDLEINTFINFLESLELHNKKKEADITEKLFLIYALKTNPRLQNKVRISLGIEQNTLEDCFYAKEEDGEAKEPADSDIRKFIPSLSYLGGILANHLDSNKDNSEFDKIAFSLSADMALIFNTKYPSRLTLFYYDSLLLLNTVYYSKKKNSGSQMLLDFIGWYLPVCIACLPNDFYGLGLKVVGLYSTMILDEKKKALLSKLTYLPMKALAASCIKEQSAQTIVYYREYIKKFDIDGYDKTIQAENFLNIGISLCIRCTDECNREIQSDILDCIIQINEKIKPTIVESVKFILDYGIAYARTASNEDKHTFIDSMKGNFFPHQAQSLLED